MFYKTKYIGVAVFILLIGCKGRVSYSDDDQVFLVPNQKYVSLSIDSFTPPISDCTYLHFMNGQPYYVMKGYDNDIIFFDIQTGKEVLRVTPEIEGPNGIGYLRSFSLSSDSVIYAFSNTYAIYKLDFSGSLLGKYDFLTVDNGEVDGPTGSFNAMGGQVYEVGNSLQFSTLPSGDWNSLTPDFFEKFSIEVSMDTVSRKAYKLAICYPKDYYKEGNYGVSYQRIMVNEDRIYSFSTDDKVYKVTPDGTVFSSLAKSDYVKKFGAYSSGSISEYLMSVLTESRYQQIIYDHYRDVYYRFAYIGDDNIVDDLNSPDLVLEEKVKYRSNPSVIILNNNLKKIGETKLEADKYSPNNYMILEDGLYLSLNNPSNENMAEDKIEFECLVLEEQ